jgi:hypothetical protein
MSERPANHPQIIDVKDDEWVTFPGGELEGKRPKAFCNACRDRLKRAARGTGEIGHQRALCFQCYRAGLERERAIKEAGQIETASEARFQAALPFDPVNRPRLEMLKADRTAARANLRSGPERFASHRRHAQIAARHALETLAAGLRARTVGVVERDRVMADAIHAAELQLPDSWLPFVVAR